MKIIIALFVLIIFFNPVQAAFDNVPISDDQYAHIFGSAFITQVCTNNDIDPFTTFFIVMGIGVIKEVYDIGRTGFSFQDLTYNAVGVGFSLSVDEIINRWNGVDK